MIGFSWGWDRGGLCRHHGLHSIEPDLPLEAVKTGNIVPLME
jgi:hypothetical protein